jgi:hypothetical protein
VFVAVPYTEQPPDSPPSDVYCVRIFIRDPIADLASLDPSGTKRMISNAMFFFFLFSRKVTPSGTRAPPYRRTPGSSVAVEEV